MWFKDWELTLLCTLIIYVIYREYISECLYNEFN